MKGNWFIILAMVFFFSFCLPAFGQEEEEISFPLIVPATFSEVSREDSMAISGAHLQAKLVVNAIYQDLLEIAEAPCAEDSLSLFWNQHRLFVKWLGKQDESDMETFELFENHLSQIKAWLDSGEIKFKVHTNGFSFCRFSGAHAYTNSFTAKLQINLCPEWFVRSRENQVGTIVHELVHELGYGHPEGTVLPIDAIRLAKRNPEKARKSPENYENLAQAYFREMARKNFR